jgi:hypothetical protein
MSLRKRLRVLKAALTQEWHEHRCVTCRTVWVCQGSKCRPWPDDQCATCEAEAFEQAVVKDYRLREWA